MRRLNFANGSASTVRVVVLGGSNVGKSALVVRFLTKRFIGEYASGIEITYQHEVNLAGNWVTTEICDALICKKEQNHFKEVSNQAEGFLLVYSICNRGSFEYACKLALEIKETYRNSSDGENVSLLLVGNKSDLDHFREVKKSEGETFAKSISLCHFVETSAAESYSEVERAFKLIFGLVRTRMQSLPVPSVSNNRSGRKNSFSQVAHMIRGHYRRQNVFNSNSNNFERELSFKKCESLHYDRNNNSTIAEDISNSRRRKSGIAALQNNFSPVVYNGKARLNTRCLSLSTLNENLNVRNTSKFSDNTSSPRHLRKSFHKSEHCNVTGNFTYEENLENLVARTKEDQVSITKMSLSSDDTLDLSDMSTPEEDAIFNEMMQTSNGKPTFSDNTDQVSKEDKKRSTFSSVKSSTPVNQATRKNSLNKMGLHLPVIVHSDGECEEKKGKESDALPPKSAPILASSTNNKFRFYPNGALENQDLHNRAWLAVSNSNVPLSPLLESAPRSRIKSPKEEKRSPSHNFLKQFFKGTLYGASAGRGSNSSLLSVSSESSLSSAFVTGEFSRSLTSINEHSSQQDFSDDSAPIYFRSSTTSLASTVSSEVDSDHRQYMTVYSAPSSPRVRKHSLRSKGRRPSFREAVSELIGKRKKSITSESINNNKERFI